VATRLPIVMSPCYPGYRTLHVTHRACVVAQNAHAQWRQLWCIFLNFIFKHFQCPRRLTRYEHAFSDRKQMTNQIGDRMALAGARRSLNEYASSNIETLNNLALFIVG